MKVSELKYQRADYENVSKIMNDVTARVKNAQKIGDVLSAREDYIACTTEFWTQGALAYMRYTINTADEFYTAEKEYYDEVEPKVLNLQLDYYRAVLESPFKAELEKTLSPVLIKHMEVSCKAISPDIIPELAEENRIVTEYSNLMAGMEFEFRGETMPRSILTKYFSESDRDLRREAYEALGNGFKKHESELDDIFDRLVHVRDKMAKKMGCKNFVELGYYRMGRLCYDEETVKGFRKNVLEDIVPAVSKLKTENALRMGINDFMMYDDGITVPGGDPKPSSNKDDIFAAARDMYHEMSEETGRFIDMMLENEAFDVESRKNKWGGGYCTNFEKYDQPFILANFNGTAGDVDVVTHEAGHALADYLTRNNKFRAELNVGGMETAETHSMSMEFFAWKYIDKFFGDETDKYKYMHAFNAFSFIPYGTMVDHFQHIVYENPDMTPHERKEVWKKLESEYRPYMSIEGIPYLEDGNRWQYQMHIYETPFYYIDYCLAQVTAFQFLLASLKDYDDAISRYFDFVRTGGEKVFTDLVRDAGLRSPFEDGALKDMAEEVTELIEKIKV